MEKGILLVATEHPYYGKMAYNLAVTIKATEPEMPVAVLFAGAGLAHLNKDQLGVFDHVIEITDDVAGTYGKLLVYEYSPFQKTLFIDADNVWLPGRKPSDLMNSLNGIAFTAITEGKYGSNPASNDLNGNYTLWADAEAILEAYSLQEIYQWRSEVMYFEKGYRTEELFETAKALFSEPRVEVMKFAGTVPDEFALNIAAATCGIEPHVYRWQPTFWLNVARRMPKPAELFSGFWILSTGGSTTSLAVRRLYDNIVQAARYKLRTPPVFPLRPKRTFLTERRYI